MTKQEDGRCYCPLSDECTCLRCELCLTVLLYAEITANMKICIDCSKEIPSDE